MKAEGSRRSNAAAVRLSEPDQVLRQGGLNRILTMPGDMGDCSLPERLTTDD